MYRGMQSRFGEKKWKSGKREGAVRREKMEIPFSLEEFRAWLTCVLEDSPFCEYCQRPLTIMNISPDHAKPVSRQGSLDRANLRGCCDDCNRLKGELLPGEFRALLKGLATFTEAGRNDVLKRLRGAHLHFGDSRKPAETAKPELKGTNVLAIPAKRGKVWDPTF
jgi:5-methylcytosine-specific restriction endonuclease McrA